MEIWPLIILFVIGVPLALAIWLSVRTLRAKGQIESLARRVNDLELQVISLKRTAPSTAAPKSAEETAREFKSATLPPLRAEEKAAATVPKPASPIAQPISAPVAPPPMVTPPPVPKPEYIPHIPPAMPKPTAPKINWEQFLGVKGDRKSVV